MFVNVLISLSQMALKDGQSKNASNEHSHSLWNTFLLYVQATLLPENPNGNWTICFYAPLAHIMYLTVSSRFLISFVMGGSGPSRTIKFIYEPEWPEQGD
jgi:hypothetical protein